MKLLILSGIVLLLSWIMVDDLRNRTIMLVSLICLVVLLLLYPSVGLSFRPVLVRALYNSLFICFILISGTLIVKTLVPAYRGKNILGSGDFLFLISISPLMCFRFFIVFLIFSFLFNLILYWIIKLRSVENEVSIPLAGGTAMLLIPVIIYSHFFFNELTQNII